MNIDQVLQESLKKRASDLHITVGKPPVMRIDGMLVHMELAAVERKQSEDLARQLLSSDKFEKLLELGEVDAPYVIPKEGLFRVNCFHQRGTISIAIRVLQDKIYTIEELSLPGSVASLARNRHGLLLVTGPTGSGKSTTTAAIIDLINSEQEQHIITLEDPIEYFHHHKKSIVSQREIGRDSMSFPNALRAALRQDPDVIFVGEMRDLETISIALTAAETGHLVLATLHTIDAAQTVERIIDAFPAPQQQQVRTQLANSLVGIISQRLIKRHNQSGRIAAVETMLCTHAIRNLIREGKIHQIPSTIETSQKFGMQTFDKHLQYLYEGGLISKEECHTNARDKQMMDNYFARLGA